MTDSPPTPAEQLAATLRSPRMRPALCAFLTAGYPSREAFAATLRRVEEIADVVEIGVPFSDPMADGVTLQRASRAALEQGVNLGSILDSLAARPSATPRVIMSYLNPLLALGLGPLASRAAAAGIAGFVVPDLPLEESHPLRAALEAHGLALVQMVTPATPAERMRELCRRSAGFVYAVTLTGTTGSRKLPGDVAAYLRSLREVSTLPVLAGFGIRTASQVRLLGREADGVIVGSALIEEIDQGRDPAEFLRALRDPSPAAESP